MRRDVTRACGIIGVSTQESDANLEIYEGLLMLQHRGQDSAGIVTTDRTRFHEHKGNGLVKDVFDSQDVLGKLTGGCDGMGWSWGDGALSIAYLIGGNGCLIWSSLGALARVRQMNLPAARSIDAVSRQSR